MVEFMVEFMIWFMTMTLILIDTHIHTTQFRPIQETSARLS
jgi:hypothetical protein